MHTQRLVFSHVYNLRGFQSPPYFHFCVAFENKNKTTTTTKKTPPQFTKYTKLLKIDKYVNLNPYFGFIYLTQSLKTIEEHESCIFMRDLHRKNRFLLCVCGSIFVSLCCLLCAHNQEKMLFFVYFCLAKDAHDIIFEL